MLLVMILCSTETTAELMENLMSCTVQIALTNNHCELCCECILMSGFAPFLPHFHWIVSPELGQKHTMKECVNNFGKTLLHF